MSGSSPNSGCQQACSLDRVAMRGAVVFGEPGKYFLFYTNDINAIRSYDSASSTGPGWNLTMLKVYESHGLYSAFRESIATFVEESQAHPRYPLPVTNPNAAAEATEGRDREGNQPTVPTGPSLESPVSSTYGKPAVAGRSQAVPASHLQPARAVGQGFLNPVHPVVRVPQRARRTQQRAWLRC